ncbi:MAG: IS110 family transposase [Actinomycetota bacterium]|jgi:transposase|nr:IS110 family transposase [Actinomycetota bacterium]
MPDVSSIAPAEVDQWIVFDVHKNSLVAGVLPAAGGSPEVTRLENTERAVRRFLGRFGDPGALAVAYEAGPCGYELFRLLSGMGVACDVIAPSLVPVRAGDRVKTDRRDAKRLVRLYRAGELFFVEVPSPAHEGLRDLVRARDDLRGARTAARHRVVKALLRHGHVYREGRHAWTRRHAAWLSRQHLADPLAHRALCHTRSHLAAIDAQIAAIDSELEAVASSEPWCDPVRWLRSFRGIGLVTALGLLAEIGDFRRFSHPRELMSYLGLTPSEYSSGDQQHRGHITKMGNRHARRLLVEAAWHYRHPPRHSARARALEPHVPDVVRSRAWQAQVRLNQRHRTLIGHGKRSTVANVAVARELCGFLWAAMTHQPLREETLAA